MTFEAVQNAVTALAQHNKISREEALQQIANGQASVNVVTQTHVTRTVSTQSLDDLSPELRAQVENALASSGANVVISETATGHNGVTRSVAGSTRCQACGMNFTPPCPLVHNAEGRKSAPSDRAFLVDKPCRFDP